MKLFKRLFSTTQERRYSGIDTMILFNWLQCLDGNFNYTRLRATENDVIDENDMNAWDKVYSSYIDCFGLNDLYIRLLGFQKKKALAQAEYVLTKSAFQKNIIRLMDIEIEKVKKEMNKGITTESVLVHLSKYMGFRQDPKKITVKEYFSLIKEYERSN